MPYVTTIDERYAGTLLAYRAGWYDAPYDLSSPFTLAPNWPAYGALIATSGSGDKDAYALGVLVPGRYAAFGVAFNWDFSNFILGDVPAALSLHDATGAIVATSFNGSLYFDVHRTEDFYVSVTGSALLSSEYRLAYTPNYTGAAELSVGGVVAVGNTVTAVYSVQDGNGTTSSSPSFQWGRSTDGSNWTPIDGATSAEYTIPARDSGYFLAYALSYIDDAGFQEAFTSQPTARVPQDVTPPTIVAVWPTGATASAINSDLNVMFSEAVVAGPGIVTLEKSPGEVVESFAVASSGRISINDRVLTIDPSYDLAYDTSYAVRFSDSAVSDVAGNYYTPQSAAITFTTVSPPTLIAAAPSPEGDTGDHVIEAAINGYRWRLTDSRTIDWSISRGFATEYWNDPDVLTKYVEVALSTFANYANLSFNFLGYFESPTEAAASGSDINIAGDAAGRFFSSNAAWGLGLFPHDAYDSLYRGAPGDVFVNLNSQANYLTSYEPGSAGWFLIIHELGHVLGLKHPHDDGGTGRPTLAEVGLGDFDIDLFTIMSYNDDAPLNLLEWDPATPMLLDVLALQYLYGANQQVNSEDTVIDLSAKVDFYLTYWDAGGHDVIGAERALEGWLISLPDVQPSTIVPEFAGYALPIAEWNSGVIKNLRWLLGEIEDARGSAWADSIHGNRFANQLSGLGGDDLLSGGGGNDSLHGGEGADIAQYALRRDQYTVKYINDGEYQIKALSGAEGTDVLFGVEKVSFTDGTYLLSDIAPADFAAPMIVALSPTDDARAVPLGATLRFTFNEPVVRGNGSFALLKSDGTVVATYAQDSSHVSVAGDVVTINPLHDLEANTAYKVIAAEGSVLDAAGNAFKGFRGFTFTTATEFATSVTGSTYHWKSHGLQSGVSVELRSIDELPLGVVSTDAKGSYSLGAPQLGPYQLQAKTAVVPSEVNGAVTSADALAALRLAVGINPNTDPDGTGPQVPPAASPYQFIAADVNKDGKVTSADALAILRMAVKLPTAPAAEWVNVREDLDLWDAEANSGAGGFTVSRNAVPTVAPAGISLPDDSAINFVGVLKGDVNGSWKAPQGSEFVPDSHFIELQALGVGPLAQWSV